MKGLFLPVIFLLALQLVQAQNYSVGVQSVTWTDSSRSNRSVPVEFHYPGTNTAIASDSFGFVVFGHGFDMTINAYYNYADSLATHGYIVALTSNEGGLSPSHPNLAQDLIYIYNMMINQSNVNSTSLLYHHVKGKGAIAGHSMGGGCTVLSCQYSDTATCYWTLAEATTTPSSITAAPFMHKPYLSFAGSSDCIAPATTNQIPTYDSSGSICKTFVEIKNATHCQFALSNVACNFGEGASGCASTTLTRNGQTDTVLSFLYPYLDYYLNGNCSAWTQFENIYNADVNDVLMQSCHNVIPVNQAITGATSFCTGSSDVLTATPAGFSYLWSNSSTGSTISVSSAGNYALTVSNGTCSITAAPVTVTQNSAPATPSAITAADTVCSSIANITISVVNNPSATKYNWTLPTGWVINGADSTSVIVATSSSSGGIILVTAQNGCGSSSAVQKSITVLPSNLGTPGAIAGDTAICTGLAAQYVVPAISGANSYFWNYPAGWTLVSGGITDTLNLVAGTTSGSVTVQGVNGCGQGTPSSLVVIALSAPVVGTIIGTDSVCINAPGTLSFNLANVVGADSIYWSLPNGWSLVSGQNAANLVANNNGVGGAVSATVYNGCGNSTATPLNLTVIDTPLATITQAGDSLSTPAIGAYQWYFNGAAINGATAQTYVASQSGDYMVAITSSANCTGTSAGYAYSYLSVQNVINSNEVSIYPNPSANGVFQLHVSSELLGSRLKVFDALGRQVFEQEINNAGTVLSLSGLSKGVYLASLELNGSSIKKKLVIE